VGEQNLEIAELVGITGQGTWGLVGSRWTVGEENLPWWFVVEVARIPCQVAGLPCQAVDPPCVAGPPCRLVGVEGRRKNLQLQAGTDQRGKGRTF